MVVITHLILNDMLKIRGEIVDICMLLEDPDEQIREQVKLFLHELHNKGQEIIYNLFPNAIQRLSNEFADMDIQKFQNIAKHLIEYISKDKQIEYIIVMLCNKLKKSDDSNYNQQIEWRNSSFCLTQINFNERLLQKLIDQYESWKERMIDHEPTTQNFQLIVTNLKKQNQSREFKVKVDEFESKVLLHRENEDQVQLNGEANEDQEDKENNDANQVERPEPARRRAARLSRGDDDDDVEYVPVAS